MTNIFLIYLCIKANNQLNAIARIWKYVGFKEKEALRKNCPYSGLFWSTFSRIQTEYREIQSISLYSVRMRKNSHQNNSEYEHFSRSEVLLNCFFPSSFNYCPLVWLFCSSKSLKKIKKNRTRT